MTVPPTPELERRRLEAERIIGRLLIALTYVAVGILVIGVAGMIASGISPLDPPPVVDLPTIVDEATRLGPAGILWLGLIVVILTPIVRVAAAAFSFARGREWRMVLIAIAILIVIGTGVVTALITEV